MDARTKSTSHLRDAPPIRVFALMALLIAGCLLVWRGSLLLAPQETAWQASNPAEAQLMGILEPVTGEKNVRLTVTETGEGRRSVLVLLASDIEHLSPAVERIATQSAALDQIAGDVLIIETAEFADRGFASSTPADMMEIFAIAMICVALAWIVMAAGQPQSIASAYTTPMETVSEHKPEFAPDIRRERGPSQPALMPDTEAVARVARQDPAQAAKIIRNWMRQKGGEG